MEGDLHYKLPEGVTSDSLGSITRDEFALKAEAVVETTAMFYDTFDWRLFKKSLVLYQTGDDWIVRDLQTGADLERVTSGSPPNFVWEFPDSALKQQIAPIVGVRRLLPMGDATIQTAPYRVLNSDEKTEAWLVGTEMWSGSGSEATLLDTYVALRAVRGHARQFRRLARKFKEAGFKASPWCDTFVGIMAAAGKQPGTYSPKPAYQLKPGTRADKATKQILRSTLTIIEANEAGVKADLDIEFLHHYRTAVRRTRSALGQIKGVFPPEITASYREAFALLGEQSNQLRDLDVYLLAEPDYRAMLPDVMRDYISPLFDYMRAQRQQAALDVTDYLNSSPYATMMAEWEAFLYEPVPKDPVARNAAVPIKKLARKRIAKQYLRVIADGNEILKTAEDELVHQLRIDCKRLRYLLEFFASLFPKKEMDNLIGQLKSLQDELGDFNDLSVQQAYLLHIARDFPANDAQARMGLVAIGVLVDKLAAEQEAMKPELAAAFSDFAAANNRALFRQLFKVKKGR